MGIEKLGLALERLYEVDEIGQVTPLDSSVHFAVCGRWAWRRPPQQTGEAIFEILEKACRSSHEFDVVILFAVFHESPRPMPTDTMMMEMVEVERERRR